MRKPRRGESKLGKMRRRRTGTPPETKKKDWGSHFSATASCGQQESSGYGGPHAGKETLNHLNLKLAASGQSRIGVEKLPPEKVGRCSDRFSFTPLRWVRLGKSIITVGRKSSFYMVDLAVNSWHSGEATSTGIRW